MDDRIIDGVPVKDCIGCGYCCRKAPCSMAMRIHGSHITSCPELKWNGTRWICGAIDRAVGPLADLYRKELAIGEGCCSSLNTFRMRGYPPTPEEVTIPDKYEALPSWVQIFMKALANNFINPDALYLSLMAAHAEIADKVNENYADFVVKELHRFYCGQRSHDSQEFMGDDPPVPTVKRGNKCLK